MFCIYLWTNSDFCHLQNKLIGFITEIKSVYSAVRAWSLNEAVCASSLKVNIATTVRSAHTVFMCFVFIWEITVTCATYSINWLVFITEMKSVYSAVRTGSLNKAAGASSLKGLNWLCAVQTHLRKPMSYKCSPLRVGNYKSPPMVISYSYEPMRDFSLPPRPRWQPSSVILLRLEG